MNRTRLSLVLLAAAGLSLPLFAPAQDKDKDPVAESYAKMHQVSLAEATSRMAIMQDAGRLGGRLQREQPDTFAGLYIEHHPVFRVVVKFTKDAKLQLSRYSKDRLFVAETAPRSLEVLRSVQDEVGSELISSGIDFESGLDLKRSEINVYVLNPSVAAKRLSRLMTLTGASFIKLHRTYGFIETTAITGGKKVAGTTENCTAGFNVVNSAREIGIATAGHCDNALNYSSPAVYLTFQSEKDAGSYDVQWNKQTKGTPEQQSNEITLVGGPQSTVKINSAIHIAEMMTGTTVCKNGFVTNYTCGEIADVNAQTSYKNVAGSYVRVHNMNNQVMTEKGDSGGPVFAQNTAYGIVHGRGVSTMANDLYFMPVERFSSIGVSVLKTPFTIGSIPSVVGTRGTTPIPVKINFNGYPKFPVQFTLDLVQCPPKNTCTNNTATYATNVPSPLVFQFHCTGSSTTDDTSRWRSSLTDASGITTLSIEFSVTCKRNA